MRDPPQPSCESSNAPGESSSPPGPSSSQSSSPPDQSSSPPDQASPSGPSSSPPDQSSPPGQSSGPSSPPPACELRCLDCGATWPTTEARYRCACGGTLDLRHRFPGGLSAATFLAREASRAPLDRSGVWRWREAILAFDGAPVRPEHVVTRGEGEVGFYEVPRVARYCGLERLHLQHEGENPTGSFKDRGMTVGITVARALGFDRVACASTGNTSASMAAYAAQAGMRAFVFIPEGKIAFGKLGQALAYGARTLKLRGDFDAAMRLVEAVCARDGIYLLNSLNPFRIEGQKAIAFELLRNVGWPEAPPPDWIALPGGNLGNASALAKGLREWRDAGLIDRLPRLAVVQAAGANPLARAWRTGEALRPMRAETLATAIRIGDPVSAARCLRGLRDLGGTVTEVDDQAILDAKASVDAQGVGAEPASCATVAGLRRLVAEGVIARDARVVGLLTGHVLKDPDAVVGYHQRTLAGFEFPYANAPVVVDAELDAVRRALEA